MLLLRRLDFDSTAWLYDSRLENTERVVCRLKPLPRNRVAPGVGWGVLELLRC